jgi:hypothetical protein
MRLSIKQRSALLRMLDAWHWKPPRGNGTAHSEGVVRHGWMRTLWSLESAKLVHILRDGETDGDHHGPGWMLTEEGIKLARIEKRRKDPRVLREVRR